MTDDFHFASEVVDVTARDLPGRKAAFVVGRVPEGSIVLDVGCGGGKMLRTIHEHRRGVTLLGCDVKEPTNINGDFTFTALDRTSGMLPYDDSSVDVALLVDVLEHVDHPETTLGEIARILRPNGSMLAFVPIEGEPISWFGVFRAFLGNDLYVRTKDHINSFTHDEVERMLAARFIVDERRYLYHFLGQLMDAALCAALTIGPVRRVLDAQPLSRREHRSAPDVDRRARGRGDLQGGQRSRLDRVPSTQKRAGNVGRDAVRGTRPA